MQYQFPTDLDAASVAALRSDIETLSAGEDALTLDMAKVNFIDSSGVGALVYLHKRQRGRGLQFKIENLHGQPKSLFAKLRLDRVMCN